MAFTYTTTFNILIHKYLNRVGRKKNIRSTYTNCRFRGKKSKYFLQKQRYLTAN